RYDQIVLRQIGNGLKAIGKKVSGFILVHEIGDELFSLGQGFQGMAGQPRTRESHSFYPEDIVQSLKFSSGPRFAHSK
ncbi:MAG TPA: hypothetical protein VH681_14635, partial [Nitrospiraceae bacterium]